MLDATRLLYTTPSRPTTTTNDMCESSNETAERFSKQTVRKFDIYTCYRTLNPDNCNWYGRTKAIIRHKVIKCHHLN